MPRQSSRSRAVLVLALASAILVLAWYLPNRPQAGAVPMPDARLNSVSFSPYRAHESPLTRTFPTQAEVEQDLTLIARRARAVRTYAAIEGNYELPALARAHGLKMWQGIWLGADRAANARELAAGIRLANQYPDVIERVVVGNEVLLRKDLPVDELIADIDLVKRQVHQPVTYADVWNFFLANPEIVPHLDVMSIHILPYWEDVPTNIDGAIAHVADVVDAMQKRFPNTRIAIGETCWPSRGRWRQDAAPSLVNQVVFLRRFIALAQSRHLDYNFFQAFDQPWKFQNEGVVGASWGLWNTDRTPKFPLDGPVQENAHWPIPAALSIACAWLLYVFVTAANPTPRKPAALSPAALSPAALSPAGLSPAGLSPAGLSPAGLALSAALLGGALGIAWSATAPVLFDPWVTLAAIGNLAGQTILAFLLMHRLAGAPTHPRSGRDATDAARALLHLRRPTGWRGPTAPQAILDDLIFLFAWTATILQTLLLYDPRYRDFPLPQFSVPLAAILLRALTRDPRPRGGPEERIIALLLAAGAIGSAIQEGPLNRQSLLWNACALLLAAATWPRSPRPIRPTPPQPSPS